MRGKPIAVPVRPAEPSFAARLQSIAAELRTLEHPAAYFHYELPEHAKLIKSTISLCPTCIRHTGAAIYEWHGKVFKKIHCPDHGFAIAVIENDATFYSVSSKDRWGRVYSGQIDVLDPYDKGGECCGGAGCDARPSPLTAGEHTDQSANKTCTVLLEVTNACNLACRVCYADAKGDRLLPLERFYELVQRLVAAKGGLDSLQITGGEACLHPDFWRMLEFVYRIPEVKKIYLPTNGIEFSKGAAAEKLRVFRDKVVVLLQFDGEHAATNKALRNAAPQTVRQRLLDALEKLDIVTQLTMTLAHGLSEGEIAWVVEQGIKHHNVRLVALLPAFYTGRFELPTEPCERLTLSDAVKGVQRGLRSHQTGTFKPIPCSHPNCGWAALYVRRFGIFANISRFIDIERQKPRLAYKTVLGKKELAGVIGGQRMGLVARWITALFRRLIRPRDVFGVVVKPFMDIYTYDQDRVSSCCHHILDNRGSLLSFCEYNTLHRVNDSWHGFPKL